MTTGPSYKQRLERDRQTQIIADEIDQEEQGILRHRLLFWPRDELTIDFQCAGAEGLRSVQMVESV
jgi:hypothetical protein